MPFCLPSSGFPSRCGSARLYFWQLTESVGALEALQPDAAQLLVQPYAGFRSDKRRREWLAVRALLAAAAGPSFRIAYENCGRPYLLPRVGEFSISHTDGLAAIALSDRPVGIDVEPYSGRAYRLRERFLADGEFDFSLVPSPERAATALWSAKESVYKLAGRRGTELKADIRLTLLEAAGDRLRWSAAVSGCPSPVSVEAFPVSGCVLTVAEFR